MDSARKAAYLALRDVEENKAYSNFAVQGAIGRTNTDRAAFARELVYGTLKNQLYLDFIIGHLVKTPVGRLPASDRVLLRMGLYQVMSLDSVPDYAAVSETVELAKRYARGRGPFVNGVLRQYIRDRERIAPPPLEEDAVRHLSVAYSFAPWIVRMWLDEFESVERVERLLEALNGRPRLCIRANTLKTSPEGLKAGLEKLGFALEADEDLPDIFFVEGERLLETGLYASGMFSVQDKASRIAAESLGARPGDTVVDVCAAPGGKTMAIAESMKNKGRIIATDIHGKRIGLIEKEAARLGVGIVTTEKRDGRTADPALAGTADRALVDAPCSGLGVVRRKPEIKYREDDEAMKGLPKTQLDILTASADYVKPGGVLVYSTCTIAKRENQDVVDAFLQANNKFELVDKIQLLPMAGNTDGFFVCKLKRLGALFGG